MSVCLSDSFVLINQEGNSMRHTPLDGLPVTKSFLTYFSFYPYIMLFRQDPFDNSTLALKGYPV